MFQRGDPRYDPDYENLRAVRAGLRRIPHEYDAVRMECYNRDEAKYIHDHLTPEERERVILRWFTFGIEGQDAPL